MIEERILAEEAALAGGEVVKRYWRRLEEVLTKEGGDLVTVADRESEAVILEKLKAARPDDAILGEETGMHEGSPGSTRFWAVDPLDGTTNFAHGFPEFCVSVGLMDGDQPLAGAIYLPHRDKMFSASLGGGAFCNGEHITVSSAQSISEALCISGPFRSDTGYHRNKEAFFRVNAHCQGIRCTGAAAVNLLTVAMGSADGFWYKGLKIWDIAAGALLVTEAGGRVTDYAGSTPNWETGEIVATNGTIHQTLLNVLKAD
jgi:myo-inositol-1(or 4)-monophosphatase